MEFDISASKVAGSAAAILNAQDVRNVYSVFGDNVLREFGIDVRTKRTFMSTQTLRQVQSFVADYGEDDAIKIVEEAFMPKRKGRLNGRAIGASLFAKNMRWYADQLLLERGGDDKPDGRQLGFWER